MIISHPILGPVQQDNFSFAALVKDTGTYPVTPSQMWHGGAHIAVNGTGGVQVRAIADGTVIAYRLPTVKPTDAKALEQHPLNYREWSDDGFVLLKHEKESGANTKVVFYSLYMHLSKLADRFKGAPGVVQMPAAADNQIKRKHQLGALGQVYGQAHKIHFEIFLDEAGLNAFIKRGPENYKVDSQGNGEADLWGDVHFVIPQDTVYHLQEPDPNKPGNLMSPIRTTHATLCVSVAYSRAPSPSAIAVNGNRLLTTYLENGEQIGQRSDPDFEYTIHKLAQKRFPQHTSAGYELIRFGRVIGPDSLPADATNWQKIPLGYGRQGWVDLNQTAIKKLSDADFPYWHWRRIEEPAATAHDGKCEPATLLQLLDGNHDNTLAPLEFARFVRDEASRKKLSYTICKFPTEWDASDFDSRWGWLKSYFKNPASRDKELAQTHKAWVTDLEGRYTEALPKLEAEHKEAEKVKKELLEQKVELLTEKAALTKQRTEAEAKLKLEQKTQTKQQAVKSTKPEDIEKLNLAIATSEAQIHCAQTRQPELDSAITAADDNIELAETSLTLIQEKMAELKQRIKTIPEELKATGEEINRAEEAMKNPPSTDPDKLWKEFKAHVEALQFWDKVPGLPNAKEVWHFHPVAFVDHFKKCAWLSGAELARIYLNSPADVLARYRPALNKVMYKYGVTTPMRMTLFLSQGAQESGGIGLEEITKSKYRFKSIKGFTTILEKSNAPFHPDSGEPETNGYYNNPRDVYYSHVRHYDTNVNLGNVVISKLVDNEGNAITTIPGKDGKEKCKWGKENIDASKSTIGDGQKYRGRGMKQLTGRVNYAYYWVYRGWLKERNNPKTKSYIDNSVAATDFDWSWWDKTAKDVRRPAPVNDPQRAANEPYNFVDTGGWYWEAGAASNQFQSINKNISGETVDRKLVEKVTKAINGSATVGDPSRLENRLGAAIYIADKLDDNAPLLVVDEKGKPIEDGLDREFGL